MDPPNQMHNQTQLVFCRENVGRAFQDSYQTIYHVSNEQTPVWSCQGLLPRTQKEDGPVHRAVCPSQSVAGSGQIDTGESMSALIKKAIALKVASNSLRTSETDAVDQLQPGLCDIGLYLWHTLFSTRVAQTAKGMSKIAS